ncbi:MAG: hypothetical protein ABI664_16205 [bacterium]
MIHVGNELDIAHVMPQGHYGQVEFADAIERALTLCPSGVARGLIMDFSHAHGVETHSVVRVRETTRHLALHGDRYQRRIAVVAPSDDITRVMEVGGVVSRGQGIEYAYCRDLNDARTWILNGATQAAPP